MSGAGSRVGRSRTAGPGREEVEGLLEADGMVGHVWVPVIEHFRARKRAVELLRTSASAFLLGAARVLVIDRFDDRLAMARDLWGAETLNYETETDDGENLSDKVPCNPQPELVYPVFNLTTMFLTAQ